MDLTTSAFTAPMEMNLFIYFATNYNAVWDTLKNNS